MPTPSADNPTGVTLPTPSAEFLFYAYIGLASICGTGKSQNVASDQGLLYLREFSIKI